MIARARVDYEQIAQIYDEGRSMSLERIDVWRRVLRPYLNKRMTVLDLGSGTGLFAEALVSWFDLSVVGVEPSDAMRKQAASKGLERVAFHAGCAERLPLEGRSVDAAWLSTVIHHIPDLARCATELRRTLRPSGPILIRSSFGDRLEGIQWLGYFPAARALAAKRWPTVASTAAAFARGGFNVETLISVSETVSTDLGAYAERIGTRANSTLRLIDDDEFARGMACLETEARTANSAEPVVDRRDLLVLR